MSKLRYKPAPAPVSEDPKVLREWINREFLRISEAINPTEVQVTWDPGSIANNAEEELDVDFVGAELGDVAMAAFSNDLAGLILSANITAQNVVTVTLINNSGAPVDLASGTLTVRLF